jgi:hypothetical protein
MSKIIHALARCTDCEKEWDSLNAHIIGAKHHKETGHEVIVEWAYGKVYHKKEVKGD